MAAAQRGIWRASELRQRLAQAGLDISPKKMLRLWSGQPVSIRLDDLDTICETLGCTPNDLFVLPGREEEPEAARPAPVPARNGRRVASRIPQRI
jgi:putative transcriptional regulator